MQMDVLICNRLPSIQMEQALALRPCFSTSLPKYSVKTIIQ